MRWRSILLLGALLGAGAGAATVVAQLTDTQNRSGQVNVSSTASVDLYICEPGTTVGPDCGADDSGADELWFEGLEDAGPGDIVQQDLRLRNVGPDGWTVLDYPTVTTTEESDPNADCSATPNFELVRILGKAGNEVNDNPQWGDPHYLSGAPTFLFESGGSSRQIYVASSDYEDIRVRVSLPGNLTGCEGNVWHISADWVVGASP